MPKNKQTKRKQYNNYTKHISLNADTKKEQNGLEEDRLDIKEKEERKIEKKIQDKKNNTIALLISGLGAIASLGIVKFMPDSDNLFENAIKIVVCAVLCIMLIIFLYIVEKNNKKLQEIIVDNSCLRHWKRREIADKNLSSAPKNSLKEEISKFTKDINDNYKKIEKNIFLIYCGRGLFIFIAVVGVMLLIKTAGMLLSNNQKHREIDYSQPLSTGEGKVEENTLSTEEEEINQPAEEEALEPSFTPIPTDEAQDSFDKLWNDYFIGFPLTNGVTIETAKNNAYKMITSEWISTDFRETKSTWPLEQIDLYGKDSYTKSRDCENGLRLSYDEFHLFQAGSSYLDGTEGHIKSEKGYQERDFGLACLRGVDLFMEGIRTNQFSSGYIRSAYYDTGLLLRQCADYVYGGKGEKCFVLYTFSSICYEIADEKGYSNDEAAAMDEAMELTLSSIQAN